LIEPSKYSAVETLRDGEPIEIRALRPQDRDDLVAAVNHISSESLYRRFFAVRRHFSESEESFHLNIDFVSHVALVALAEENGRQSIVGDGRYVVSEPGQAEVALHSGRQISGTGAWNGVVAPFGCDREARRSSRTGCLCIAGQQGNSEGVRGKRAEIHCKARSWQYLCQVRPDLKPVMVKSAGILWYAE